MAIHRTATLNEQKITSNSWGDLFSNLKHANGYWFDIQRTTGYRQLAITNHRKVLAITNIPNYHNKVTQEGGDGSQEEYIKRASHLVLASIGDRNEALSILSRCQEQTRVGHITTDYRIVDKHQKYFYLGPQSYFNHTYIPQKDGGLLFRQISLHGYNTFHVENDGVAGVPEERSDTALRILDVQETTIQWTNLEDICNNSSIGSEKQGLEQLKAYLDKPTVDNLRGYMQLCGIENGSSIIERLQASDGRDSISIVDEKKYTFQLLNGIWIPHFFHIGDDINNDLHIRFQEGKYQLMFVSNITRKIDISYRDDLSFIQAQEGVASVSDTHSCSPYFLQVGLFTEVLCSMHKLYQVEGSLPEGSLDQLNNIWECHIVPYINDPTCIEDDQLLIKLAEAIEQAQSNMPTLQSDLDVFLMQLDPDKLPHPLDKVVFIAACAVAVVAIVASLLIAPVFFPFVVACSTVLVFGVRQLTSQQHVSPVSSKTPSVYSDNMQPLSTDRPQNRQVKGHDYSLVNTERSDRGSSNTP